MPKIAVTFVAVALFGFASTLHAADAQSLSSPTNIFQAFVADFFDGTERFIAWVESTVSGIADSIDGAIPSINYTYTASAAEAVTPPPLFVSGEGANTSDTPVPSTTIGQRSAPTTPTEAQVLPVVQYDAAATPVPFNFLELQSAVATLTQGVQGLTALFETQTPSSKIESQIASLQSALASQSIQSNAAAVYPLGDGNGLAAASNIGNLSGVTITNANLTASEIPNLSGSYLSLGGGTLTGALIDSGAAASSFAGNLGIGTTSPSKPLTIDSGNVNGTAIRLNNSSAGGHTFDLMSTGSGNTGGGGRFDIFDVTSGLARLSVQSTGNVGIGTTTPGSIFSINGVANWTGATSTIYSAGGINLTGGGCFSIDGTCVGGSSGSGTVGSGTQGQFAFYNAAGTTLSATSSLFISPSGNIGIGTSSPSTNFSVQGAGLFSGTLTVASSTITDASQTGGLLVGNIRIHQSGNTSNLFIGDNVGVHGSSFSAYYNTVVGLESGEYLNVDGGNDGYANSFFGNSAGQKTNSGIGNTFIGDNAGWQDTTGGSNTVLGSNAGYAITTGSSNILIGNGAGGTGGSALTTGANNIALGNSGYFASSTASNQLDIQNIIYGTNNSGTASTPSTGNIGIGTATPYSRLQVTGTDTASTSVLAVVNSASTTEFSVLDNGNATLSGNLIQNSDQRLKTNITDLDGSSSLAEISALNPVTFNWIDPNKSSVPQFGFIAQQVQQVFPNLISTTSPTALTPDGTLSLNYIDLISPIVAAIQELDREITSLASTVAGFAQSFTTAVLNATTGNFGQVNTQQVDANELCLGSTCVTQAQLQALLAAASQSGSAPASPSSSPSDATDTPPVFQINGDNPAIIQVGTSYTDLGATITGPQADLNLGIQTYLNGVLESPIELDTSTAATDTIAYVVTDSQGLTSTSTRIVVVEAAAAPTSVPAATSSSATSTSE